MLKHQGMPKSILNEFDSLKGTTIMLPYNTTFARINVTYFITHTHLWSWIQIQITFLVQQTQVMTSLCTRFLSLSNTSCDVRLKNISQADKLKMFPLYQCLNLLLNLMSMLYIVEPYPPNVKIFLEMWFICRMPECYAKKRKLNSLRLVKH